MNKEWIPFNSSEFECPVRRLINSPFKIALAYGILAASWILVSGLAVFTYVDNPASYQKVEIIKGLIFVAVTSAILWLMTRRFSEFVQAQEMIREKKFALASQHLPAIIWTTDASGKADYCNSRWTECTGAPIESLLSQGYKPFIHPDDVESMTSSWNNALHSHTSYEGQFRIRQKDDSYRWYLARAYPVKDSDETFLGWVGTSIDIEYEKQIEANLKRSEEELSRILMAKDQFIATLSHELRSPMNVIVGWTNLMQSEELDPETYQEALEAVSRNSAKLKTLIDDLVDFSKIVVGKSKIIKEPLELKDVICQLVKDYQDQARQKNIQLETNFDRSVPLVFGDHLRLSQVFTNLLDNAFKFTPHNGHIKVQVHSTSSGGVAVTVSDTGTGIDPKFLPHLFDPFTQENMGCSREFGGMGLGLAVVKKIVEAHDGEIRAESLGKNQGSQFTVYLPSAPAEVVVPISSNPTAMTASQHHN